MSEVQVAPDEIEVRSVEVPDGTADLFDVGDPAPPVTEPESQTPAPETSALETQPAPETPAAPATPALPDWLSSDPAERRTQLEAALAALPVEERLGLAPVAEITNATAQLTANQTRQNVTAELAQQNADIDLETSATAFRNRLADWIPAEAGINLDEDTNNLIADAQANYHTTVVQDMQTGIAGALSGLGVQQLPPELVNAVNQAQSLGGVIQNYINFAANVGYQAGIGKGAEGANKRTEADRIADRQRIENELRAKLVADGWREPVAPTLSGGQPAIGDGEISDEDLAAWLRNPDGVSEAKQQAISRAMSGAMAG